MVRLTTSATDDCCTPSPRPMPALAADRSQVLAMMKALADGTRFDILRLVASQEGAICACDIGELVPVSQSTIAHHMKVLHEAGLITVTREGVWAYYTVNRRAVEVLQTIMDGFVPKSVPATP